MIDMPILIDPGTPGLSHMGYLNQIIIEENYSRTPYTTTALWKVKVHAGTADIPHLPLSARDRDHTIQLPSPACHRVVTRERVGVSSLLLSSSPLLIIKSPPHLHLLAGI